MLDKTNYIDRYVMHSYMLFSNTKQMVTSDFGGIVAVFGEGWMKYFAIGEVPGELGLAASLANEAVAEQSAGAHAEHRQRQVA